LLEEAFFTV
jgi:hypothetical protein